MEPDIANRITDIQYDFRREIGRLRGELDEIKTIIMDMHRVLTHPMFRTEVRIPDTALTREALRSRGIFSRPEEIYPTPWNLNIADSYHIEHWLMAEEKPVKTKENDWDK